MTGSKDTLRALMISMFFGAMMGGCVSPYVLVTFLHDFHASPMLISGLQVILQASLLMALPGAILLSNINPKRGTIICILVGRTFLTVLPAMLLIPNCRSAVPYITILLFGFLGLMGSATGASTNVWFKQIIPSSIQGRLLGKRNAVSFLVMAFLTPLIGCILDYSDGRHCDRAILYTAIFSFACIFGILDLYYLNQAQDCRMPIQRSVSELLRELKEVFRTAGFWRLSLFSVLPVLSVTILAPYIVLIYYDFGLSRFQIGMITAISTLGMGIGAVKGGKYADRHREGLRNIMWKFSFSITGVQSILLVLFLARGYELISPKMMFVGLLLATTLLSMIQGRVLSVYTRLIFDSVPGGSTIAFGFVGFVANILGLIFSAISSAMGIMFMTQTGWLRKYIWGEFHYAYALFAIAIVVGVAGAMLIKYLANRDSSSQIKYITRTAA